MIKACPCGTVKTVSPWKSAVTVDWRCSAECTAKYPRREYIPPVTAVTTVARTSLKTLSLKLSSKSRATR